MLQLCFLLFIILERHSPIFFEADFEMSLQRILEEPNPQMPYEDEYSQVMPYEVDRHKWES